MSATLNRKARHRAALEFWRLSFADLKKRKPAVQGGPSENASDSRKPSKAITNGTDLSLVLARAMPRTHAALIANGGTAAQLGDAMPATAAAVAEGAQ